MDSSTEDATAATIAAGVAANAAAAAVPAGGDDDLSAPSVVTAPTVPPASVTQPTVAPSAVPLPPSTLPSVPAYSPGASASSPSIDSGSLLQLLVQQQSALHEGNERSYAQSYSNRDSHQKRRPQDADECTTSV